MDFPAWREGKGHWQTANKVSMGPFHKHSTELQGVFVFLRYGEGT